MNNALTCGIQQARGVEPSACDLERGAYIPATSHPEAGRVAEAVVTACICDLGDPAPQQAFHNIHCMLLVK